MRVNNLAHVSGTIGPRHSKAAGHGRRPCLRPPNVPFSRPASVGSPDLRLCAPPFRSKKGAPSPTRQGYVPGPPVRKRRFCGEVVYGRGLRTLYVAWLTFTMPPAPSRLLPSLGTEHSFIRRTCGEERHQSGRIEQRLCAKAVTPNEALLIRNGLGARTSTKIAR